MYKKVKSGLIKYASLNQFNRRKINWFNRW